MVITEQCKLEMDNVFTYHGKASQQDLPIIMQEMKQLIEDQKAEVTGEVVTTTLNISPTGEMELMILMPVNKELQVPSSYLFKPKFRLRNAVKAHHVGKLQDLQSSGMELMNYIQQHEYMAITPGYNIVLQQPRTKDEDAIIDMYVGVSDNIL